MSIFYKSYRIGKNGKPFFLYKLKTLKDGVDKHLFKHEYLPLGHFLRKTKLDELPQLWNVLKGDMSLVGPRAEEERTINLVPEELKKILLSVKPGLTSLSSIHFFDEERILKLSPDAFKTYWLSVKPMKIALDVFYVNNHSFLLDLAILWITFKLVVKSFFHD